MEKQLVQSAKKFKKALMFEEWFGCLVNLYEEDVKGTYPMIKDFRKVATAEAKKGNDTEGLINLLHSTYILTGKDYFDDFMVAMEWNREPSERFWLPRRKHLMHICEALQALEDGELDELFISQPPRTGKTTVVEYFVIWVILRNPERSNLYSSYGDGVTGTFYAGLLEILKDGFTYAWADVFPGRKLVSTDALRHTFNIDRAKRYASFTGRSLYGELNGSCDCNGYLVADDLHSGIEEAMNKDRLNSAWLKVDNNLLPRAKENAKILWIGTRWSLADAIARRIDLLSNDVRFAKRRFKVINIPALNENDESNFDYDFGVGFTSDFYKQRRASFERNNDSASWLAQYMGQPIERDGTVFSPEDLRYYNGTLPSDVEPDRIFAFVDPAWGGGDFVAAPIIYMYGDDLYVADVVYNNNDKRVTQPLIAHKVIEHNVNAVRVEATKMTKAYAEGVDDLLKAQGCHINIEANIKNQTNTGKEQRIFDTAPEIRERMIFLESGHRSKEYELFMQNVFAFQFDGKNQHDDAPDSLAGAISMLKHPVSKKVKLVQRMW